MLRLVLEILKRFRSVVGRFKTLTLMECLRVSNVPGKFLESIRILILEEAPYFCRRKVKMVSSSGNLYVFFRCAKNVCDSLY